VASSDSALRYTTIYRLINFISHHHTMLLSHYFNISYIRRSGEDKVRIERLSESHGQLRTAAGAQWIVAMGPLRVLEPPTPGFESSVVSGTPDCSPAEGQGRRGASSETLVRSSVRREARGRLAALEPQALRQTRCARVPQAP